MTDEAGQYKNHRHSFEAHDFVSHGVGEYGRGNIHTSTIEAFFSTFKRGMKGHILALLQAILLNLTIVTITAKRTGLMMRLGPVRRLPVSAASV